MKVQDKPPEKTTEVEIGSLPETEFRIMILMMMQDLRNRMTSCKICLSKT